MASLLRDSSFGQIVRLLSANKLFRFPDEVDPSLSTKFAAAAPLNGREGGVVHSASRSERPSEEEQQEAYDDGDNYVVDWYGEADPENPQNWPDSWKNLVSYQMYLLNFSVYIASSIYVPSIFVPGTLGVIGEFGVSETVALLGLSLYTVGYGIGPMLWSPLSELPQLGRSNMYVCTLLVFVLLQLGTGFAVDMGMFLAFRTMSGFFGSPALVNAAATIGDMYNPAQAAYGICIWAAFAVCGPIFGPLIGGFVAVSKGWRWTIWVYTWVTAFCVVMMFFLLPETSAANILYRRARRLRNITGNTRIRSQSELDAARHTLRDRLAILGRAFILLATEPIVLVMDTFTALVYGVLFIWFESFPLVFGGIYGFSVQSQGLAYLGILVGLLCTIPAYLLWIKHGVLPAFSKPNFKAEMMLPPIFAGSVALPVCLFWYGWTARESIPWIVPIIGSSLFTVGVITVFNPVFNYLGVVYQPYSASVFAGNTLFRASFGAAFPLFAKSLFQTLGIGPGNSLLGGVAVLFIPISFGLYLYGSTIRHWSKNARHDV